MTTQDFGFATVSFVNTRTAEKHDVTLPFTFAVDVDTLDSSELAWEAAAEWPTAGWDQDVTEWAVQNVTVTVEGVVTEILPSR